VTTRRTLSMREILVATDFSSPSSKAFEAGFDLAQHFGARLHVLHVVPDGSEVKTAKTELESFTSEPIRGFEIVRAVSVGQAAPEIVKYAQREKIDVIVLGTHGRSGLGRVFMGSVAEAVLRNAPCQVLTIGPKAQTIRKLPRQSRLSTRCHKAIVWSAPSPPRLRSAIPARHTFREKLSSESGEKNSRDTGA